MTSCVSSWETKIDHRLRALLARTQNRPEEATQCLTVLMRFVGDAKYLCAYGIMVRSVAGDIATATIALSDIPKAASAPEILFIELSHLLGPDPAGED